MPTIEQPGGERPLLEWLLSRFPDMPRTRAKQRIQSGRVTVNGVVVRKPHAMLPDPGAAMELLGRSATDLDLHGGWHIHARVTLLHLDTSLAVVNKGPGLISVPAPDSEISALSILEDFLAGSLKPRDHRISLKLVPAVYRKLKPLPVHRLDQFTTGVFCMAMNPGAREDLIEQLRSHTMTRQYIAYVQGKPPKPRGTWTNWLELSPDGLRQRVSMRSPNPGESSSAERAVTHYELLEEFPATSRRGVTCKLRLKLETGRKHQIRVQAAHAGLPLVGDRIYNPAYRRDAQPPPSLPFDRQALHAELICLRHPGTSAERSWRAEFPPDLRQLETTLRTAR